LNLQPGEIVEVRSQQEIESNLDPDNKRGSHFHSGMLLDCGTRARVVGRVDRIIDERTGRMLKLRGDCVVLDGLWCDESPRSVPSQDLFVLAGGMVAPVARLNLPRARMACQRALCGPWHCRSARR
jgi:hypothetical protein